MVCVWNFAKAQNCSHFSEHLLSIAKIYWILWVGDPETKAGQVNFSKMGTKSSKSFNVEVLRTEWS